MTKTIHFIRNAAPVLLLLGAGGCTWGLGFGESETTEMHRHFSRTVDIQTGVVVGDLERATSAGEWLATYSGVDEKYPQGAPYLEDMRAEAFTIAQAPDLDSVAEATGRMAAACGNCHSATDGGPHFVVGSMPPAGGSDAATMIRHLWAADRMWEGLVGPSSEAWQAGAKVLAEDGDTFGDLVQTSSSPDRARSYVSAIQELGLRASEAVSQDARAMTYADLLGTCNRCHSTIGVMAER